MGFALGLLCAVSGCASYRQGLAPVRKELREGDAEAAAARFEQREAKPDQLEYRLEQGLVHHLAGHWQESNLAFEAAERLADEHETKSLTQETAALLLSDRLRPYRAARFELQLVPYYRAFNYVGLGQLDEALVEARKANYESAIEGGTIDPARGVDPFLHYLTGLLYAAAGEANDALVSFRSAVETYGATGSTAGEAPAWLLGDYREAAERLGSEADQARARALGADSTNSTDREVLNVVIFLESGFVPYKESITVTLPIFDDAGAHANGAAAGYYERYGANIYHYRRKPELGRVLSMALPKLVEHPPPVGRVEVLSVGRVEVLLPSGAAVPAHRALELDQVAASEFEARLPSVVLRALVRAIAKQAAAQSVAKRADAAPLLGDLLVMATEEADTRSWTLLPQRIDLVQLALPEGKHELAVRFYSYGETVVDEQRIAVEVSPGTTSFLRVRSFR